MLVLQGTHSCPGTPCLDSVGQRSVCVRGFPQRIGYWRHAELDPLVILPLWDEGKPYGAWGQRPRYVSNGRVAVAVPAEADSIVEEQVEQKACRPSLGQVRSPEIRIRQDQGVPRLIERTVHIRDSGDRRPERERWRSVDRHYRRTVAVARCRGEVRVEVRR